MGQFTSLCKQCDAHIYWFLTAPDNHKCTQCGTHNTANEIEQSWWEYYATYLELMKYYAINGYAATVQHYRDNRIAGFILERTYFRKDA